MAATNLSPRQKMINMMYLVLTAILALNVSSEVLDAFKTVNDGINITSTSQSSKNGNLFSELNKQYLNDSIRTKQAYTKALKAKELSDNLHTLLEQYKLAIIAEAGGIDSLTGKIHRDDDVDIATRMFVENNGFKGKALKKEIENTRTKLLDLLNDKDRNDAGQSLALKIDEPVSKEPWEYARFNHVPVVAAVTLLSKYENDLLSSEGSVIERLFHSVNANTEVVDVMQAKVMSPSAYVIQGQTYQADVMVAASNSTLTPEVFIGAFTNTVKKDASDKYIPLVAVSDALPLLNPRKINVDGGIGKLSFTDNNTGYKRYSGVIRTKNATTGQYKLYPFDGEYQVAPKTVVVSPTMVNVMYIGLDNTIDVSVPGVAQSDVSAAITNGTLVKNADGHYVAKVFQQGETKVEVSAKINGKELKMGQQAFRVKRVPDPVAKMDGTYGGGKIKISQLKSSRGIVAKVENFEYGAPFKILSYQVSYYSKKNGGMLPIDNTGPSYIPKVADLISKQVAAGDNIFIDEIIVKGPAGDNRKINPIAFQVIQ